MMRTIRRSLSLLFLSALVGCSGSIDTGGPQVAVQGSVTFDGKALSGAVVQLIPAGKTPGFGSTGRTGPDGKFKLKGNRGGEGACPGQYKVVISRMLLPSGEEMPEKSDKPPIELGAVESLPLHYSQADHTVLTATVPPTGGNLEFALVQGPAPPQ